eukprot:gene7142-249_t
MTPMARFGFMQAQEQLQLLTLRSDSLSGAAPLHGGSQPDPGIELQALLPSGSIGAQLASPPGFSSAYELLDQHAPQMEALAATQAEQAQEMHALAAARAEIMEEVHPNTYLPSISCPAPEADSLSSGHQGEPLSNRTSRNCRTSRTASHVLVPRLPLIPPPGFVREPSPPPTMSLVNLPLARPTRQLGPPSPIDLSMDAASSEVDDSSGCTSPSQSLDSSPRPLTPTSGQNTGSRQTMLARRSFQGSMQPLPPTPRLSLPDAQWEEGALGGVRRSRTDQSGSPTSVYSMSSSVASRASVQVNKVELDPFSGTDAQMHMALSLPDTDCPGTRFFPSLSTSSRALAPRHSPGFDDTTSMRSLSPRSSFTRGGQEEGGSWPSPTSPPSSPQVSPTLPKVSPSPPKGSPKVESERGSEGVPRSRGPGGSEVRGPGGSEVRGPAGFEVRGPAGSEVRGPGGSEVPRGRWGAAVVGHEKEVSPPAKKSSKSFKLHAWLSRLASGEAGKEKEAPESSLEPSIPPGPPQNAFQRKFGFSSGSVRSGSNSADALCTFTEGVTHEASFSAGTPFGGSLYGATVGSLNDASVTSKRDISSVTTMAQVKHYLDLLHVAAT